MRREERRGEERRGEERTGEERRGEERRGEEEKQALATLPHRGHAAPSLSRPLDVHLRFDMQTETARMRRIGKKGHGRSVAKSK